MNKVFVRFIFLTWLISLVACNDFLDKAPQDEVSNDDALNTTERVDIAMVGVYNGLRNPAYYFTMMIAYPEFAGGNIKPGSDALSVGVEFYDRVYKFTSTAVPPSSTSTPELDIYGDIYEVINRANNVINAIPNLSDGTESQHNSLLGEALFIRALAHFDLVRVYGQAYNFTPSASHLGVAVLRQTPAVFEFAPRNSVAEVYAQIIEDLQRAAELINANAQRSSNSSIWLSTNAAKALLARVYLYQGDWANAAALANEVIESGDYTLASNNDYESIWSGDGNGKEEVIFEIDMGTNRQNSVAQIIGNGQDQAYGSATADLRGLFSGNDVRGTLQMITSFDTGNGLDYLSRKYIFSLEEMYPITVLRLSEMYLIRAEANAELGQDALALADLNLIRQRANPSAASINLTGNSLVEEILRERRRELAFEGHCLFDFTRKAKGITRVDCSSDNPNCSLSYPNNLFVLPIPQDQLDANPQTVQNPGY